MRWRRGGFESKRGGVVALLCGMVRSGDGLSIELHITVAEGRKMKCHA